GSGSGSASGSGSVSDSASNPLFNSDSPSDSRSKASSGDPAHPTRRLSDEEIAAALSEFELELSGQAAVDDSSDGATGGDAGGVTDGATDSQAGGSVSGAAGNSPKAPKAAPADTSAGDGPTSSSSSSSSSSGSQPAPASSSHPSSGSASPKRDSFDGDGGLSGGHDGPGESDDFDIPDIADDPSLLGIPDTADDLLSEAGAADTGISDADAGGSGAGSAPDSASDATSGFDEELEGLIGNRAKASAIITRLASAELLAAFCRMSDIDADCIDGDQGAVAVLRDLDGDAPEVAAADLTDVVSGMAVVLAVNRADKLDATLYLQGEPGQTFAPPVLFSSSASFVEDLMLGIATVDDLRGQGASIVPSDAMDQAEAMRVIARHTRLGRRGSPDE
uniref:hypothetical protein n=1 Tax=uncultured Bifidobacterium sp. TaxID=165187 RepID=UPI0037DCDBFA